MSVRPVGGGIDCRYVCTQQQARALPAGCGESRQPLQCHRQRDISRRCRNQQRGGQSGRLTSECSETTTAWICRYYPGRSSHIPCACSPIHPDPLRPVAVRWVFPSRLVSPQPRTSVLISPPPLPSVRISPSPSLSSSKKKCSPSATFPFSPLLALPSHRFLSPTGTPSRPVYLARASSTTS